MASLKKLAGQTVWYGLSSIAAKLLYQLMTPLITYILNKPSGMVDYGNFSLLMTVVSFVNIIYTYGMETAYFRFSSGNEPQEREKLFQTTFSSLIVSSIAFSVILILFRVSLSDIADIGNHPEYITWCVLIVAIDTLAAIPFARLRQEDRPRKYAFTRLAGIVVNIFVTVFLIAFYPSQHRVNDHSAFSNWYFSNDNAGFMLLANLAGSAVTFLLLAKEWMGYRFRFDFALWKKIIVYSAPMIIIGLGGMVNETFDRQMLKFLSPKNVHDATLDVGIYSANYKIAIFITLFITAFRMSAEPFFFNQSADKNAPKSFAKVMKWFVVVLCFAFLFTSLYIDIWKYFIGSAYRTGIGVVPILLAANVCLGIYYNLSVWYKLTNKMHLGMFITLIGAAITLIINFIFIPRFGMYACAWATFAAYCSMMVLSYVYGQRYFAVPYNIKKLLAYLGVMVLLYFTEELVRYATPNVIVRLCGATVLMLIFLRLVAATEKEELKSMPLVGKFIR